MSILTGHLQASYYIR